MDALLSYEAVDIFYNGYPVVQDICFTLRAGEVLGIVGESGSGKSTIIKAIMGLLGAGGVVAGGHIWFQGQNLGGLTAGQMRKICGAKIGMVFQDTGACLCPIRTIGSQIYESLRAHTNITKGKAKEKALDLFEKLSFKDGERILDSYSFELSGGMNQRVGIAMAMLMNPLLLLADEPTSALDVIVQKKIIEQMLFMRDLYGSAILLVTHNMGLISAMADSVMVLKNGSIREYGSVKQVLNNPQDEYTKSLLAAVPKIRRS